MIKYCKHEWHKTNIKTTKQYFCLRQIDTPSARERAKDETKERLMNDVP